MFGLGAAFPDVYQSMADNKWRSDWVGLFVNNELASTRMAASFGRAWTDLNTPPAFKQYTMICPEKDCPQTGFHQNFHRSDHAAFWHLGWPAFHISGACVRSQCHVVGMFLYMFAMVFYNNNVWVDGIDIVRKPDSLITRIVLRFADLRLRTRVCITLPTICLSM